MANALIGDIQSGQIHGQNGRQIQWGTFAFDDTDTTCTIATRFRVVEVVIPVPVGTPAGDEGLSWADTLSNGVLQVPDTGLVTIGRNPETPTANLQGAVLIIGW